VTARDRTVLIVVGLLAVLGGFWFLAIGPKRKEAADVSTQVTAAQTRLDAAQASAASAQAARKRYNDDYATVARLGKAVPVDDDMPSLVYQLESTAHANHVDFRSIKLTSTGTPASAPTGAAAAVASATGNTSATGSTPASTVTSALPPGATVGTAGFPTMPFSFDFNGSFFHMQRFLKALDGLTTVQGKSINVKGRLLTVDGVSLKASAKGFPDVDATVVVTAYLLPADEGLTAGAAPAPGTSTASTTGTAGSTATASLIGSDR
jgi:type II secretory pathway pseudopilin PulG